MDSERGLKPVETQRALQALWGGRINKRAVQTACMSNSTGDQTMDVTELHALVRLLRTIFLVFVLGLPDTSSRLFFGSRSDASIVESTLSRFCVQ